MNRASRLQGRRRVLAGALAMFAAPAFAAAQPGRVAMPKSPEFDRERFVDDCLHALADTDEQAAVAEVTRRAFANPRDVLAALGAPREAGLDVLHRSPRLTIFAAKWAPNMTLLPHDHRLWAIIGLYTGREDNIFWRRGERGRLEAARASALFEGDVAVLPVDAIHSVNNPLPRFTGGIHVYGGDFFATPRSQWDPETLAEQPSNGDTVRALFERENARLAACERRVDTPR